MSPAAPPPLGLILTNAPDLPWLRRRLHLARAEALKVITVWGLDGGWTPAAIAQAAQLTPALVVRTEAGDPTTRHPLPLPHRILDELAPWLAARPDAYIELGNEPLIADQASEDLAWTYRHYLAEAIALLRREFPRARLIAPAHLINHPIRLGDHPDGVPRFLEITADVLRQCDALSYHAYTAEQLVRGLSQLRTHVSASMPVWLTEFALNEPLAPTARAAAYRQLLGDLPIAGALLYHLAARPGGDLVHFNPHYALDDDTLAALGASPPPPPPSADPDARHYPDIQVDGFALDVRHWRTVASFRRHLARYDFEATAPWAKGVTLHHTWRPAPREWRGADSMRGLARFYRHERGWAAGPHLFVVGGSPAAAADGIWQLTPLSVPGVHAVSFNGSHWGIEMVGDFDAGPIPPDTAALVTGAAAALLDWAALGTGPATLNGHRSDPQTAKSCPGRQADLSALRRAVAALRDR